MVQKQVPFIRKEIALCRNCGGVGMIEAKQGEQMLLTCPVCQGSGRVVKEYKGTVSISPYVKDPYEGCFP